MLAKGDDNAGLRERTLQIGLAHQKRESVKDLAVSWGVKPGTILTHLSKFVEEGHDIPAGDILELSALSAKDQA